MERGKNTDFILRQFKKKSKRAINKDFFTEFFYLNRSRGVIEILQSESCESYQMEVFFKEFIPDEFRDFIYLKVLNENEEEVKHWYFDSEKLVLAIGINWGFKKEEISVDINIENFEITKISEDGFIIKDIDYTMLNDYFISFLTIQARKLAKSFKNLSEKNLES